MITNRIISVEVSSAYQEASRQRRRLEAKTVDQKKNDTAPEFSLESLSSQVGYIGKKQGTQQATGPKRLMDIYI